jgi:segregation and condensation protein B
VSTSVEEREAHQGNGKSSPENGEIVGHLTALLFVADEPLELSSIARVLEVTPSVLEGAVKTLTSEPPAGLIVQRHGKRVQLATAPDSADSVRRLKGSAEAQRLSRAALEVLSIVAYRQPATRAEIEAVRGVNSDHVLDTLLARGLVAELGRREAVGRPMMFGTTLEFLQLAGLKSLDELPPIDLERGPRNTDEGQPQSEFQPQPETEREFQPQPEPVAEPEAEPESQAEPKLEPGSQAEPPPGDAESRSSPVPGSV